MDGATGGNQVIPARLCRTAPLVIVTTTLALGSRHLGFTALEPRTTPVTNHDVLSVPDGRFCLDGRPFA